MSGLPFSSPPFPPSPSKIFVFWFEDFQDSIADAVYFLPFFLPQFKH